MRTSRRVFLSLGVPLALFAASAAAQKGATMRMRMPRLSGGQSPSITSDPSKPPDPAALLKEKQETIRKEVRQLYQLAGELKQETESTDSAAVLSLPLLKKAQQIQKIAKHIQSLARG
jgi:hypothetical protein